MKFVVANLTVRSIGKGTGEIRIPETEYKNYRAKAQERGEICNG